MITRPVAVARSVIVTGALWGAGSAAVVGVFSAVGASSTIELGNGQSRVQVVWLGAHAFVACVATLVGVTMGGSALTRRGVSSPRAAVALVGGSTLVLALAACVGLLRVLDIDASTVLAMAAGALIGTAGATFFVAQSGEPDSALPYGRSSTRTSRSWSTR